MLKGVKPIVFLVLVVILAVSGLLWSRGRKGDSTVGEVDATQGSVAADAGAEDGTVRAIDFTLPSLDGKEYRLMDTVADNKVTIINFFATWCPPCRAETPEFVRFYGEYGAKGVEMLSVDLKEGDETVKRFVGEFKMTNPILMDRDGEVANAYGVYSIPTTLVIDSEGLVANQFSGMITIDTLSDAVDAIL